MPSLRNKILRTYGFSKLVMLAFAMVVFFDLYILDRHIERGQAVTAFREATLELRRDEKNLFLYHAPSIRETIAREAQTAHAAFERARPTVVAIGGEAEFRRIQDLLSRYLAALQGYAGLAAADAPPAQAQIRALGHELAEASEALSQRERQLLAEATRRAGLTLLLAFVGVVILGLAGGMFLVHRVVRPLRELQAGLVAIDEGRARTLPLPSRDQEIESFVAAFNAMLKHMRQQQDQAKRNEKAAALGVLVSGVAHELNNPLSNISTAAQLLVEEGEQADPELRRLWLSQIESETERSRRIVRRLLDSVRQRKLQRQRLALADLIQSSLTLVNGQLPAGVQVCVGMTAAIDVEVDRERMHQVFINLIKNAADAGARHITVRADLGTWDDDIAESSEMAGDPAAVREASLAVRIIVEDDGPGIPPEARAHIFDPFFTTRAAGEGTGLGLYLVEEIVSEHRGCIVVEGPAEGGTRFSLWLPLGAEASA